MGSPRKAGKPLIGLVLQSAAGEDPCSSVGELWNSASLKKRAISPSGMPISTWFASVCWESFTLWPVGLLPQQDGSLGTVGWDNWAGQNPTPMKLKKWWLNFQAVQLLVKECKGNTYCRRVGASATWATPSPKWSHPRGCTTVGNEKDGGRQP